MQTVIAIAAAVGMFGVFMPAYLVWKEKKKKAASILAKGLCTLLAVLLCFAGAMRVGTAASWWMTAGLFVCMIADIAIELQFISGVIAFLLAHLCYITAFCHLAPPSYVSIAVFVVTLGLFLLFFHKILSKTGEAKIPLLCYAAVISAMLAIAVMLPFSLGAHGWITAAGAVLFVISDMTLARNMYIHCTRFSDAFSLSCYYLGQYLLALSVYAVFLIPLQN